MEILGQREKKWKDIQLGECPDETIGSAGCIITDLSMMLGTTPDLMNKRVKYVNGCLVSWKATAEALDMNYSAIRKTREFDVCIAEVKLGKIQHFVVLDGDKQLDPWYAKESNYPILSYRNISPKIKPKNKSHTNNEGTQMKYVELLGSRRFQLITVAGLVWIANILTWIPTDISTAIIAWLLTIAGVGTLDKIGKK